MSTAGLDKIVSSPRSDDAGPWTRFFNDRGLEVAEARPTVFRRSGGRRALVGFELTIAAAGGPITLPAYLKIYSSNDRYREVLDKWAKLAPRETALGEGVVGFPEDQAVLHIGPNDAARRFLAQLTDTDKLKRLSDWAELPGGPWRIRGRRSRVHRLSYKPEHRLVLHADLALIDDGSGRKSRHELILRAFPDRRGERLSRLCTRLREDGLEDVVPEQRGTLLDGRVHVEDHVAGEELGTLLSSNHAPIEEVVSVLSRLHRTRAAKTSPVTQDDVLGRSLRTLGELRDREGARQTARLIAERRPDAVRAAANLHGDLHPRQFIVEGETVHIIDFERAAVGDPLIDIGRFVAELAAIELEEPGSRGRAAGRLRDRVVESAVSLHRQAERDLPFFVAAGLVEVAAIRDRRAGWTELGDAAPDLLEYACSTLASARRRTTSVVDREATWQKLHPRRGYSWPAVARVEGGSSPGNFDRESGTFAPRIPEEDLELPALPAWLPRGELIAYRPGRRATIRCRDHVGGRTCFVKLSRPGRAARSRDLIDGIAAALETIPGAPETPARVKPDSGDAVILAEMGGDQLRTLISTGAEIDTALLAKSLRAFQSATPPDLLPHRSSEVPWDWLAWACGAFPDGAADLTSLALRIRALLEIHADHPECMVHGDLHPGNVIISDHRIGFIDLDQCCRGEAALDVGNLAAELTVAHMQMGRGSEMARSAGDELIAQYSRCGGIASLHRIHAHRLASLLRLVCVYTFRRAWPELPGRLLGEVNELVDSRG